jgi:hypothetical protein
MRTALLSICTAIAIGACSSAAFAAKSGAGSGAAGGTAYGGNTGHQNQTWTHDSARGDYQQRARWLGGPP